MAVIVKHKIKIKRKITTVYCNPELLEIIYPVGKYISDNIRIIKVMIEMFLSMEKDKNIIVHLICTGSSGAIMSGIFAASIPYKSKIFYIKKDNENSHGDHNGYIDNLTYKKIINVVIDDFVDSGSTLQHINKKIDYWNNINKIKIDYLIVSSDINIKLVPFHTKNIFCQTFIK